MDPHREAWREGRDAWKRLRGWFDDSTENAADPALSLHSLSDVTTLRHLLDQTELAAVRAARAAGKSWTEIATRLGITRQSAWERWRDLDDLPEAALRDQAAEAATVALIADQAAQRRGTRVKVPNVIGMRVDIARTTLLELRLVAAGPDPDGPPITSLEGTVTDQTPESGARVPQGSLVRLWLDAGGGSGGVREPRRPRPGPRELREMRPEPADEAVS